MTKISFTKLCKLEDLIPLCHRQDQVEAAAKTAKVKEGFPPNIDYIVAHFPNAKKPGSIFAFGDTIYNNSYKPLSIPLLAHECTHLLQQKEIGGTEKWWGKYLEDPAFVLLQELDAYRVEYRTFKLYNNRHFSRAYLKNCADRLAGPLYWKAGKGVLPLVQKRAARHLIEMEIEQ